MTTRDWATWAAIRSVVEAIVRSRDTGARALARYLVAGKFRFDGYKAYPGNYRSWDHQLRQGMLVHTHNAVIALAPIDGFLHQHNNLDTLGTDAPESRCRMH